MPEGARGASPERGPLPRVTLPDEVLYVRTQGRRSFRRYKNLDSCSRPEPRGHCADTRDSEGTNEA
jgi:hypothetical protein